MEQIFHDIKQVEDPRRHNVDDSLASCALWFGLWLLLRQNSCIEMITQHSVEVGSVPMHMHDVHEHNKACLVWLFGA